MNVCKFAYIFQIKNHPEMIENIRALHSSKTHIPKQIGLLLALTIIFSTSALLVLSGRANAYLSWNQACSFNGNASSYISVPNNPDIDLTGSFTLEAWINPSSVSGSKGIVSKGVSLGTSLKYGLRISAGRILLATNGSPRLFSKSSTAIPLNVWTHVAGVFDQSTNTFSIYINGVLDTTSIVASASPQTNSDSMYVGISGASSGFNGKLDEVRIWNRALSSAEVGSNFRSVLATSSGVYNGLVLSLPFQKQNSVSPFSTNDFSASKNPVNPRNVSPVSYSLQPSSTISTNQAASFDGSNDYIAAPDTSTIESSNEMTLDMWLFPVGSSQTCNVATKGNQYILHLIANKLCVTINGNLALSNIILPSNNWSRVTVSFKSDSVRFYFNGLLDGFQAVSFGTIPSGSDSLFIGGVPGATADFNGMIDEFRIQNRYFRSQDSVFANTYKALDLSNDLTSKTELCYNFDGYLFDNEGNGGPEMYFRNNAHFSNPATAAGVRVSPLLRGSDESYMSGFYLPTSNLEQLLPNSGTSGTVDMNIPIYKDVTITDMEVMIAVNHARLSDLLVDVISPSGVSVRLMTNIQPLGSDNSARIIFSDQADSTIGSGKYASVSGYIKPENSLTGAFGGQRSKGLWRVRIKDDVSGETGRFHVCGIRINQMDLAESNLALKIFLQGTYKTATNTQVPDTIKAVMMKQSDFSVAFDTAKAISNASGICELSFKNIPFDESCILKVFHRNSVETWASNPIGFIKGFASYDMSVNPVFVFGQNVVQVRLSPARYAIYSGDVNQDRAVDATDVSMIDNDASNFLGGYVLTDLTGDNFVDGTDFAIADNNAANFVIAVIP
jgi:subtilisin-like proprotein convertase family protein